MKLLDLNSQHEFEAEIIELNENEFELLRKSKRFEFNWSKEKDNHVFKIVEANEENASILGLISLLNFPEEFRIHINLIESSNENKGKDKQIDRIAGCLLAFAARMSFDKGYLGFVSLTPKTKLISLYTNKYGFSQYGRQLAIEQEEAIFLIKKYL
ncbi:MAG: hypothetical protein AAF573_00720 [Bacteroidota bacterium]